MYSFGSLCQGLVNSFSLQFLSRNDTQFTVLGCGAFFMLSVIISCTFMRVGSDNYASICFNQWAQVPRVTTWTAPLIAITNIFAVFSQKVLVKGFDVFVSCDLFTNTNSFLSDIT